MYYLGRNFEDGFLSVSIQLGYLILSQKMDEINAAAMWQESNKSRKAQRIIVRHLSNFSGKRLIVPEYCITELRQNHVPPTSESIILNDKTNHFWTKPLDKLLTRSLLSEFGNITDKGNLDNKLSQIDIVIGGNHGQGKFRSFGKFIMRDKEGYNKDSYVIKNNHIDCTKDTYEICQRIITTPINNHFS